MISFDEAVALVRQLSQPLATEQVPLDRAAGRVLARPVVAPRTAPAFPTSAMDGYAVRDSDLAQAPVKLRVAGESYAGRPFGKRAGPGTCVRIFTGAVVPPGFDRVVIQEQVGQSNGLAFFDRTPSGGRHIRPVGSDFFAGEAILPAGIVLTPQALIAAAGADVGEVCAVRQPRIAILATGDELAVPGTAHLRAGAVPDSVSVGIAALAEAFGGAVVLRLRIPDTLEALESGADEALACSDIVVVTGGASVGERDYARDMFRGHAMQPVFSKVAMKPGKPVWMSRAGARLVVGLPGNPGSALVTARLFLAPLVAGLSGRGAGLAWQWQSARLGENAPEVGDRETFYRGQLHEGRAVFVGNQDSSAQAALGVSRILIRRAAGAGVLPEGREVSFLPL
ncbi:molybdopterin molybdotransferase [Pseudochelatococcus lubricantis]|uniref:Molybdopterin molybdenumtransferase n=1 Tax=Pseudochelatococcus lubricantis TaxID=1538102 RepID=A0ABX0V3T7_9HYPH|nr:molybdopterin molybdotransferase MoeA [Pseudochelatococcus lubricantis]NIJ59791.1 molybdopterin molybdotransferase [Pseudochelatococcus lubricantis]